MKCTIPTKLPFSLRIHIPVLKTVKLLGIVWVTMVIWPEYHCQHLLISNYYYDLFVILPELPQKSNRNHWDCMLYKQNLNYNLRCGCLPQAVSNNYTESALQNSLLLSGKIPSCLQKNRIYRGKSGSHPHVGLRKRRGRGVRSSPKSRRRGRVVSHPQTRGQGSAGKGAGGLSLASPDPSLLLTHIT